MSEPQDTSEPQAVGGSGRPESGAPALPGASSSGWVGQLSQDDFSLSDSIGGVRGSIESVLPGLVFVITYVLTYDLKLTLILSSVIALAFLALRLIQRTSPVQAFAGIFGVAIGVAWAALSGKAENYFAWGLIANGASSLAALVSVLVRHPLVALVFVPMLGLPQGWKDLPAGRTLLKRSAIATWVWAVIFGLRFVIQGLLFLDQNTVALGTVKLVMGLPLFALGAWATWVLLRGELAAIEEQTAQQQALQQAD